MELCAEDFGKDFAWGVSTAAYQIEGAHLKHGKGPSIWDEFTHTKGKIARGQNGDIACDFYQNYHQDIALIFEDRRSVRIHRRDQAGPAERHRDGERRNRAGVARAAARDVSLHRSRGRRSHRGGERHARRMIP